MKGRIFTLGFISLIALSLNVFSQNSGTGTGWGGLFPSEALVLNDNFMGYDFFHSDDNPDAGNSNNSIDPVTQEVVYGYTNRVFDVPYLGAQATKATYDCYQCAFAPEWQAAWAYRDAVDNTTNVSDGFIEVSRDRSGTPGEIRGHFIVDLRELSYVEVIEWSHSSCGGTKRGFLLEYSIDDSLTWDTLRYQPGNTWTGSFTKDIGTGVKTSNEYNCQPSAYGMVWEEGIWSERVMLRFSEGGGQVPRIHDLKVYGVVTDPQIPDALSDVNKNKIRIHSYNKMIKLSKNAQVKVFDVTGKLIKSEENTNLISMSDIIEGVYIVKAQLGNDMFTSKVFIK